MEKKWIFELTLYFESEEQPADHTTFYDEDSTIDITDLSEQLEKPTDRFGTKLGKVWGSVENPMELYKFLQTIGDHNTLSFRPVWDGGFSTSILRSLNWNILPKVELKVYPGSQATKESGIEKYRAKPIIKFTLAPAQVRFVGYESTIGGERFAVRFGSLHAEFR
ncbi:MAG TPA: hypothetical protein VMM38_05860 [Aridibacter sp.]|nr:hypothetical protein [Aridibacter sp.]